MRHPPVVGGMGGYVSRGGGVTVVGASVSESLIPWPTFGVSESLTTKQIGGGALFSGIAMSLDPAIIVNMLARAACN